MLPIFSVIVYSNQSKLYQVLVFDETIPDVQKNKMVMVFSEVDKRLLDGADEHLSILDLSMRISAILAEKYSSTCNDLN